MNNGGGPATYVRRPCMHVHVHVHTHMHLASESEHQLVRVLV